MNKYSNTGLEVRLYTSSYRLPLIIAKYPNNRVKTWLTITLPPYKSINSFMLKGECEEDDDSAEFIKMMGIHFNTIWKSQSVSVEEYNEKRIVSVKQKLWNEKLISAKENRNAKIKSNEKVLIEVAAQHPLIDGMHPNEEFKGRLDKAIEVSRKYSSVYFYVPGSIHKPDKISLSEAGTQYLINSGIDKDRIFAEESNNKYAGNNGVYNSTDECFVASRIYDEENFSRLICICSPVQVSRKVLSYISFGIYPSVETFNCDEMFHNYVEEYFRNIPALINETAFDKNTLKIEGELLRNSRMPSK